MFLIVYPYLFSVNLEGLNFLRWKSGDHPISSASYEDKSRERPFKCSYCDQAFYLKHHLKSHFLCHTGERLHQCHLCEKSFARSSDLKRHYRTVHTK